MRSKICTTLGILTLFIVASRSAFADDVVISSCPSPCTRLPSTSAHNYVLGFRTEPYPYYGLATVDLRGAKAGRVLVIDASMSNITPTVPITFEMIPRVTGNVPPDSFQDAAVDCGGTGAITPPPAFCGTSGHWWLDLDQHPELLGGPIAIGLTVGTQYLGSQEPLLAITLSARIEKK